MNVPCQHLGGIDFSQLEENFELMYHCTCLLRDAKRSVKMPLLFSGKFSGCDLSLGGYGGEIIRAKYNIYPNIKQFTSCFYKTFEAEKICGFKKYGQQISEELNSYYKPENLSPDLIQNWYYATAKTRIGGSAFLQMSSMYGDVIHPFMDWY